MRLIAVGASVGGVRALRKLLGRLPGDLDAVIRVVVHLAPWSPGHLPENLQHGRPAPLSASPAGPAVAARARLHRSTGSAHAGVDGCGDPNIFGAKPFRRAVHQER